MALGQGHGRLRTLERRLELVGERIGFPEPRELDGAPDSHRAQRGGRARHLLEEAQRLRKTSGERVCVTEARERGPRLELPLSAHRERALQRTDGSIEVAL